MYGSTAIAVKGLDSVVVCTQKKVPDKLIVPSSVSHIFNISDTIGCICVGNMNDAKYILQWLRNNASHFKFKFGYEIPVHVLATRYGNYMQQASQSQIRPLCVNIVIVGVDEETGPAVYRVDPSGASVGFKAVSIGTKE